jgi:hypothetical protein
MIWKSKKKKKPKTAQEETAYSDDFNMFWDAYPRKEGKAYAFACYERAIAKGYKRGLIILRAEQFAQSEVGMGMLKHIPHASTWLNQRRFLDEPAVWNSFGQHGDNKPIPAVQDNVDWNYKG